MTAAGTTWAGNYTYRATRFLEPETLDELRRVAASEPRLHALASRHAFNDIADSDTIVSMDRLPREIAIDREAMTVTVSAGVRYGDLAVALEDAGLALHTMASLPHISVGGAVATATHGSGDRNGNLATAVTAIELITSEGEIVRARSGDPEFTGMVVHLGALGIVTRLTLRVEPSYRVTQRVYEHLDWDTALAEFDAIMGSASSVSLFTDYGDTVNQVWRKQRLDEGAEPLSDSFFGAQAAERRLHPVAALPADGCTEQLGLPGAWLDRIPHFRMAFTPSAGEEIQSEYLVPRHHAVEALAAIRPLGPRLRPHLLIAEVRSVAADDLWMSTAYERDSVCLHFTFRRDPEAVARLVPEIEATLAPFAPRPHWGKIFMLSRDDIAARYSRLDDFRALASRLDPRGAFRNAFLARTVFD